MSGQENTGPVGGGDLGVLRDAYLRLHPPSFEESLLASRPEVNVANSVDYMLSKIHFSPIDQDRTTGQDPLHDYANQAEVPGENHEEHEGVVGSLEHAAHSVSAYIKRVVTERNRKGKTEAASIGIGKLGGVESVVFATHFDFLGGSMGSVVCEKIVHSLEIAKEKGLPWFGLLPSGGFSQDEAMVGRDWLSIITVALKDFVETTGLPAVGWSMDSYGGMPASIEGQLTVRGGMAGTSRSFSGPRVIEVASGKKPSPGSLTMENAYLHRNVQVLARNPDEILDWTTRFLEFWKASPAGKFKSAKLGDLKVPRGKTGHHREIRTGSKLGDNVIESLLPKNQKPTHKIAVPDIKEEDHSADWGEILYRRYMDNLNSAGRLDTDTLMRLFLRDFVPFYNPVTKTEYDNAGDPEKILKEFPEIIGGLGMFGNVKIAWIGNQPSYALHLKEGRISKRPAMPDVEDYRFQLEFLEMAERMGAILLSTIDTPGAKTGEDSEIQGQPVIISKNIGAVQGYEHLTATISIGADCSGGAAASSPMQDYRAGTERAIFVVADPFAQAAIKGKTTKPTPAMVKERLVLSRASAQENLDLRRLEEVIPEHTNPFATAREIHAALARYLETHQHLKGESLARHRQKIIDKRTSVTFSGSSVRLSNPES